MPSFMPSQPFSNENETLVVQFSVKYEQGIDCGGRYVKLFPDTLNQEDMHSEYYIMFDHKDTHLYTLIIHPNATYEVKIDNQQRILKIRNLRTGKTEFIPDPNAKKPEDWNEAMDGEWEGPLIPNLKYKGQWKPQIIDNPNYQGEWIHPEIDNPKYKPDPTICHYYNISVLGLDLWQVKSGSIFDNFLLTNDEKFAEVVGNKTQGIRKDIEKQRRELHEEMEKRKQQEEAKKKNEKEKEREGDIGGTEEEGSEEDSAEESGTNRQLKEDDAERAFLDKHVCWLYIYLSCTTGSQHYYVHSCSNLQITSAFP
ncbi:calreticulin-like [Sus scrofa]|uniref:calreticulin-like n=1 Tax=Sus scrofa TaxID=9823 RepID=UPI000A2B0D67|nr:calreticulin-like [Sus scrofa]